MVELRRDQGRDESRRIVLYVADAMTGQDAISAGEFNARTGVTGVVLTKMDGDARGGAALSVVGVVGVPIAFVGIGERLQDLEPFHADRLVSRMLGHGRRAVAHRAGRRGARSRSAAKLEEKTRRTTSRWRIFATSCGRSRRWGRSTRCWG